MKIIFMSIITYIVITNVNAQAEVSKKRRFSVHDKKIIAKKMKKYTDCLTSGKAVETCAQFKPDILKLMKN